MAGILFGLASSLISLVNREGGLVFVALALKLAQREWWCL